MSERVKSYAEYTWGEVGSKPKGPTEEQAKIVDRAVVAAAVISGATPASIVGRARTGELCDARFVMYELCMRTGKFKQAELGRLIGKDHGTISNGVKAVKDRMNPDERAFSGFRELYNQIRERYEAYEKDPERMVQELSVYDG